MMLFLLQKPLADVDAADAAVAAAAAAADVHGAQMMVMMYDEGPHEDVIGCVHSQHVSLVVLQETGSTYSH